jgi:hypothetical protein
MFGGKIKANKPRGKPRTTKKVGLLKKKTKKTDNGIWKKEAKKGGLGKEDVLPLVKSMCSIKLKEKGIKSSSEYDCFTKEELISMIEEYNHLQNLGESEALKRGYHKPLVQTFVSGIINVKDKTKKEIIDILEKRFGFDEGRICQDKSTACILSLTHKNVKLYQLLEKNLNPLGPTKGKFEWLSNFDIDAVMGKVMETYPDFLYLGTVPIDFAIIPTGTTLDHFDISHYLKNTSYRRFGIIFNTDLSSGSGIHWIAIFIDATHIPDEIAIEFFDSVAPTRFGQRSSQPEIENFMKKFEKEAKEKLYICVKDICKKPSIKKKVNIIPKQKKDSECGVYSLWFLTSRLDGKTFEEIDKMPLPDDVINWGRATYFRGYLRKFG